MGSGIGFGEWLNPELPSSRGVRFQRRIEKPSPPQPHGRASRVDSPRWAGGDSAATGVIVRRGSRDWRGTEGRTREPNEAGVLPWTF